MRNRFFPLWMVLPCVMACGDDEAPIDSGSPFPIDSGNPLPDAGDGSLPPGDAAPDALDGTVGDSGGTVGDAGPDAQTDASAEPLTSTGFPIADHCAPLTFDGVGAPACNDTAERIQAAYDSGIDPDSAVDIGVDWKELATPMVPGSPYAITYEVSLFDNLDTWQIEVWGVMSPCATGGEQAEFLGSTRIDRGRGVYCVDTLPSEAYTHVMLVMRQTVEGDGYAYFGQGYCPGATCPSP